MKMKFSQATKENAIAFTIAGVILLGLFFSIQHIHVLKDFMSKVVEVMMPFIIGFSVAFLLHPTMILIERKLLKNSKMKQTTKRKISAGLALVLAILVVAGFLFLIFPSITDSIVKLSTQIGDYAMNAEVMIQDVIKTYPQTADFLTWLFDVGEDTLIELVNYLKNTIPTILDYSIKVVGLVFDFVMGLIIALYILCDRERFYIQIKKVAYTLFSEPVVKQMRDLAKLSSRMFNSFIVGKIVDSLIIGIICYVGMSLIGFDFALLISFIVGCTNVIPVFGPFIGAVPGFVILLIVNPLDSLWFLVFIFALQQFDGNILGPLILGDSMGIPTLYVMFAILVGGGFFGVPGMFLGVPIFSIIYVVVKAGVEKQLEKKQIVVD
ncbi:MAG: AI-2E family transporter [Erysipelotrichaceae bacterium]|nr:AI-2E family transporter [Erysipelotrichaceae bacterium]